MTDLKTRKLALKLAVNAVPYESSPTETVQAAELFLTFLTGGPRTEVEPGSDWPGTDYYVDEEPDRYGSFPGDTYVRRFAIGQEFGEGLFGSENIWVQDNGITREQILSWGYTKVDHDQLPGWAR